MNDHPVLDNPTAPTVAQGLAATSAAPSRSQVIVVEQYGMRAGGQVVAEQVMRHLGDLGRTAVLLAPQGPWPPPDSRFSFLRISTRALHLLEDLRAMRRLVGPGTLVVANGPRIIHLVILMTAGRRGARSALYVHNVPHHSRWAPAQKAYLKATSRFFDLRLVVAGVLRPLVTGPVVVLHNCCRRELEISAEVIRRTFSDDTRVTVKTLVRDDPVKGFAVLEEAVRSMSEHERATMTVLGSVGPSIHSGLMSVTRSTGPVELVENMSAAWFQPGDVVCVPSLVELSPLVVFEAMARGAVVVTTRVGGLPEVLEHGVNGFMVPPGSAEELARCLVAVAAMPRADRLRVALAARATLTDLSGRWHDFWEVQTADAGPSTGAESARG